MESHVSGQMVKREVTEEGEVRMTKIYAAKIFENFAPNCVFVVVFVFV